MKNLLLKVTDTIRTLQQNISRMLFYGLFALAGVLLTWFTFYYAPLFTEIGLVIVFLVIFFGFWELFDAKVMKGIDTIYELKGKENTNGQGNIAYGLFCVAVALLVVAAAIIIG